MLAKPDIRMPGDVDAGVTVTLYESPALYD
jgi:hypothetical protein